jgi:hypothetical protein
MSIQPGGLGSLLVSAITLDLSSMGSYATARLVLMQASPLYQSKDTFGGDHYTGCPTTYQTRQFFNNFTTNEDIAQQLGAHYRHIPLHFSPTNILLFKSRRNIFIGFGIIKEPSGLVGSGTPCISTYFVCIEHSLVIIVVSSSCTSFMIVWK